MDRINNHSASTNGLREVLSPDSNQAQPRTPVTGSSTRDSIASQRNTNNMNGPELSSPQTAPVAQTRSEPQSPMTPSSLQSISRRGSNISRFLPHFFEGARPLPDDSEAELDQDGSVSEKEGNNQNRISRPRFSLDPNYTVRFSDIEDLMAAMEKHIDDPRSPDRSSRASLASIPSIHLPRSPQENRTPVLQNENARLRNTIRQMEAQRRELARRSLDQNLLLQSDNARLRSRISQLEARNHEQADIISRMGQNSERLLYIIREQQDTIGKYEQFFSKQNQNSNSIAYSGDSDDDSQSDNGSTVNNLNSNEPKRAVTNTPTNSVDQNEEPSFFNQLLSRRLQDLTLIANRDENSDEKLVTSSQRGSFSNFGDLLERDSVCSVGPENRGSHSLRLIDDSHEDADDSDDSTISENPIDDRTSQPSATETDIADSNEE